MEKERLAERKPYVPPEGKFVRFRTEKSLFVSDNVVDWDMTI